MCQQCRRCSAAARWLYPFGRVGLVDRPDAGIYWTDPAGRLTAAVATYLQFVLATKRWRADRMNPSPSAFNASNQVA